MISSERKTASHFFFFARLIACTAIIAIVSCLFFYPAQAQHSLAATLYKSGVAAYDKGNFREALRIFKQCKEMGASSSYSAVEESQLLYSLAETLRQMGQLQEADTTFKQALKATDSLPLLKRQYFWLFNGMALLNESQGRFTEAEGLWNQCEKLTLKFDLRRGYPVNNLAHLYFVWGKLNEETEYVKKSADIAKRGAKTLALPSWHLSSAELAERKGLYTEAEGEYKAAVETCTKVVGANHAYNAYILTGLAELYRKQSKFAEAEKCLDEARRIFEQQFPNDHPDVCETMVKLGKVFSEEGKYSQAGDIVANALKTEESVFGAKDNLFTARAKACLGTIYRQEGRYQDAQSMLEQALSMQQRILGQDNIEVAVTKRDLALVHEEEANYKEAESLLNSSLQCIDKITGPEHPERAVAATALAHAYLRDEKYADAEPLLKKALDLSEQVLGSQSVVTANGARDLGVLYLKQKQYKDAENYLQKALSIDEGIYGAKSPVLAADLMSLATALSAQGESEKAEALLHRAADIKNVLPGALADAKGDDIKALQPGSADRPVSDKWALVIGISNFKDSSINLKYAAKDATDFKNFLINHENFKADHVKLLTDESASRENIIGTLGDKWLASHVHADDLVLVYVSSHGSAATDSAGGTNFLVAHDTNKNSLPATGIPLQWINSIVADQVKSKRVILILDVCHSGSAAAGQKGLFRADGPDANAIKIGEGQMIICSCMADQISWESTEYENSVFTRCLMEALQTKNQQTTIMEAFKQLKTLVESEVLRDRSNLQTPLILTKQWVGGDPVLSVQTESH